MRFGKIWSPTGDCVLSNVEEKKGFEKKSKTNWKRRTREWSTPNSSPKNRYLYIKEKTTIDESLPSPPISDRVVTNDRVMLKNKDRYYEKYKKTGKLGIDCPSKKVNLLRLESNLALKANPTSAMKKFEGHLMENKKLKLAQQTVQANLCYEDGKKLPFLNFEEGLNGQIKKSFLVMDSLKKECSLESLMKLNINQLRKLGDKLKITFSSRMKKGALRSQIITHLGLVNKSTSFKVEGR